MVRFIFCLIVFAGCGGARSDGKDASSSKGDADLCTGVTCDSPSPTACIDASTLRTYAAHGTCSDGTCTYSHTDALCASACQDGVCAGNDPCNGVTCDSPSSSTCIDATTLRAYLSDGTCSGGACSYAPTDVTCDGACQSGACTYDPCAGITCMQPPAAACYDSVTLHSYQSVGSCYDGSCSYQDSYSHCASGCVSGACCMAETDAELCAAKSANCGALSVVDRCGITRSITSCGTCSNPLVCGGTAPNLCSCAWSSEVVAQGPAFVNQASMVLDPSGAPQIAFWLQDAGSSYGSLVYTHKSNGSWAQTPLATGIPNLQGTGLATDSGGALHLVDACSYYHYASGTWSPAESYCAPSDKSLAASVVVSSNGTVHVAYLTQDSPAIIRYAARTSAGVWSFETIESGGPSYATEYDGVPIALMPGDVAAVAYPTASEIHFATRASSGTWSIEPAEPIPAGEYTNLTMEIDSSGVVRLDYQIGYGQQEVAVRSAGSWTTSDTNGWGVLAKGFPPTPTIASIGYSGIDRITPLVLFRQSGSSFTQETIEQSAGDGSFVNAAIVDGSGTSGTIWVLVGADPVLTLYHRCAFP